MARRSAVLVGVGAVIGTVATLSPLVFGGASVPTEPAGTSAAAPAIDAVDIAEPIEVPAPTERPTYTPTRSFAPLVAAVSPAVVSIEIAGSSPAQLDIDQIPPMFRQYIDPRAFGPQEQQGEGSGFVVSADGLVLTNHHVIRYADTITVKFADGKTAIAKVLGSDAELDIALLQLDGPGPWPFVALGDSGHIAVGDWVLAVGNPLGLGTSVTAGIISGKGRVLGHDVYDDFLQTDAAINPGNSGGPLFDLDGNVIGITTAIINGANTVGFAIPIDVVEDAMDDLRSKGHVARGFMGVKPVATVGNHGAMLAEIYADTPASRAGLRAGDVITRIDDHVVADPTELVRTIGGHDPGQKVILAVVRGGETIDVAVELGERPVAGAAPIARTVRD